MSEIAMQKTGIAISNNQVVLRRVAKRGYFDVQAIMWEMLKELPPEQKLDEAVVEKIKNEMLTSSDVLDIPVDGLEVINEHFKDHNAGSYCAWVKNNTHAFYINIAPYGKNKGAVTVKKTTLKPKHFGEIKIINKNFIKTNSEVFYFGKKIRDAHAASFQQVAHTQFFTDERYVYSYTPWTHI